jgi:hypothetical protein
MVDSERTPSTAPPAAIRGHEIAQMRGWVSNDVVEAPPPETIPFPVALIVRARDEAPISEGPQTLRPRNLEQVLAQLRDKIQ